MLVTFEGKGCKNCPFFDWHDYFPDQCSLSNGGFLDIEGIPSLAPDTFQKPEDCPFAQRRNVNIIAAENK